MQKLKQESTIKLNNAVEMPVFGFGTYRLVEGEEAESAILAAFNAGYRMIDTASVYKNETSVGQAIQKFGLLREEVFITTKVWNSDQGYESTIEALKTSLNKLGVSYVDLYLVHWPTAEPNFKENNKMLNKREETWKAMEEIYRLGLARAIGVSNYTIEHLKEMQSYANTMPAVNQVEFHPYLFQKELLEYCRLHDIVITAACGVARNSKIDDIRVLNIAKKHDKTISQVLLRWGLQKGIVEIPRSSKKEHILENISIFDFELDRADMDLLDSLNENLHLYPDPAKLV